MFVLAQEATTTFRTGSQEVVLDMVVRDAKGKHVKNLEGSEVEIYENGVKQQISSFKMVAGKQVLQQAGVDIKKGTATKTVSNPLPAVNLICIVFHNLDPDTKKFAVDAAQELIKNNLQPGTWVAVFGLDTSLMVLQQFTNNREELMQAAAKAFVGQGTDITRVADAVLNATPTSSSVDVQFDGNPAAGGSVSTVMRVKGGDLNQQAINNASVGNGTGEKIMRGEQASARRVFGGIEGMRQTDQIIDLIESVGKLPGRKSIVLMSPGLATTGDTDRFDSILSKANNSHVTFYAVDVTGLTMNSNLQAGNAALKNATAISQTQRQATGSAGDMMERMRQTDYTINAVRTTDTQASLRNLAEGTGGFLIGGTNDLRKPFMKIMEDLDTHYEIIYKPSTTLNDGRLRKIEVKLARTGLTADNRTGYFAMPPLPGSTPLTAVEQAGLAALSASKKPEAFPFQTAALEFRKTATGSQRALAFELPASALTATADPEKKMFKVHLAIMSLVKDSHGEVVAKFSQDSPFDIPEANFAGARNSIINFTHSLELPPGHYTVDTAIVDLEGKRASANTIAFDNDEKRGLQISSLTLVQQVSPKPGKADPLDPFEFQAEPEVARRVMPELNSAIPAAAKPGVYFVVYPDPASTEKVMVRVEFLMGGQLLAKQEAPLPPPDATGAIPMVVGAVARPGECELRITALQGKASAPRILKYTVAAPTSAAK